MSARQCPICHWVNGSMTEVAGDLHCLACGYVADVPMEAWDECEAQKDARIAELEAELRLSREQTEYANDAMMAMCQRAERAEDKLDKAKKLLHAYYLKDPRSGSCLACDYTIDSHLD